MSVRKLKRNEEESDVNFQRIEAKKALVTAGTAWSVLFCPRQNQSITEEETGVALGKA